MSRYLRRRWVVALALALVVVASVAALRPHGTRIVAYFSSASGIYQGDPVKVMGVVVGSVHSIQPEGDHVRLELDIDSQPIPASARAAIVSPSLVTERFVQLAPAYKQGARISDGAVIPLSRTATPVSFDDVKRELTDLATALGPKPGQESATGSLNEAVRTLAANLNPDAAVQLRESLAAMQGATQSLATGGTDLFATLQNLNKFVQNLAVNDRAARDLTTRLAGFSGVLDQNKVQLGSAIAGLDQVLTILRQFVNENGSSLDTAVSNLEQVAQTLASRSTALAGFVHAVPTAVDNLHNMMENGAITARLSVNDLHSLAQLLCGSVLGVGGTAADCKAALAPLLSALGVDSATATQLASGAAGGSAPTGPAPTSTPSALPLLNGLLAAVTGGAR